MKLKKRGGTFFEETAASSDIAFLLIIYFLVIAGFNVNHGFLMNLPERDSRRYILRENLLRFEMNDKGVIFYQGAAFSITEAELKIRRAVEERPDMAIVLSIDPLAPWQQVVLFVELAQKLEVDSFSFNMQSVTPHGITDSLERS